MHHAIECQHFSPRYLQVGARKRAPMGQLLHLIKGVALLRLGQHELLIPAGSSFWLPAEALAAFTPLAGCEYALLSCSMRLSQSGQSGWLTPSPLLDALLASLHHWDRPRDWQGSYGERLRVIHDELQHSPLIPQAHGALQQAWQDLASGKEEAQASWNSIGGQWLDGAALASQWRLVQALRLLKGGSKQTALEAKLHYKEGELEQACQQWLGCPLAEAAGR